MSPSRPAYRGHHAQYGHAERQLGSAPQTAEWDTRYSEFDGTMWSGRPNGRLVADVADLVPGRALDVGCGEGADAIWLARGRWTVTAIDISDVAVGRARDAAERAGVAVEWVCGDALLAPFQARSFDLVSMQYPALPKAAGEAAVLLANRLHRDADVAAVLEASTRPDATWAPCPGAGSAVCEVDHGGRRFIVALSAERYVRDRVRTAELVGAPRPSWWAHLGRAARRRAVRLGGQ